MEILLQIESTAMWTADCPLTYVYRLKKIQPSITGIASTGKRFPQETGKHKRLYTHTHIYIQFQLFNQHKKGLYLHSFMPISCYVSVCACECAYE